MAGPAAPYLGQKQILGSKDRRCSRGSSEPKETLLPPGEVETAARPAGQESGWQGVKWRARPKPRAATSAIGPGKRAGVGLSCLAWIGTDLRPVCRCRPWLGLGQRCETDHIVPSEDPSLLAATVLRAAVGSGSHRDPLLSQPLCGSVRASCYSVFTQALGAGSITAWKVFSYKETETW